jgi:hypothetical protein
MHIILSPVPSTRRNHGEGPWGASGARKGFSGYLSDSLEERESGWSRRRSAKARNERRIHSGAGS